MNNDDERDYAEESYNRALLEETDEGDGRVIHDLTDFPHQYVTTSREIPLTLSEYNKAGKTTLEYESDKRVERYFLAPQGEVWVLWHITDIPENSDDEGYSHITHGGWGFTAKDGTVTMVTAYLFFTRDRAMDHIRANITDLAKYAGYAGDAFYSHVYEMDTM